MMFELCEETALLLYPWVFRDEEGNRLDKSNSPYYQQLINDIFPGRFDIAEEIRMELNEDTIEKMFVESGVTITDELVEGTICSLRLIKLIRLIPIQMIINEGIFSNDLNLRKL